jgi:acyl-CoA thioester hydrolase
VTGLADAGAGREPIFSTTLEVRWRDLDAYNHVNNSVYLTYLEEARLRWLSQAQVDWAGADSGPVAAALQMNYRQPITWPGTLRVEKYLVKLGNSSVTLGHRIVDAGDADRVFCEGEIVLVWIDKSSGRPVPLPDSLRRVCGG